MNKWLKVGMAAALVAVIAVTALGAGTVFAQGPGTTPPAAGLGLHLGGPQNSLVAIAAQTLGMERTALVAELNAGKTIADVAKAKNVAVSKIVDAIVANRTAALKAAVDAKRITQAQMDAELNVMKEHVTTQISAKWSPRGAGMGRGLGMGQGFVDANKDGICDNCGAGQHTAPNQPAGQPFMGRGRWAR
ncbi:MAG: hypothetical protein ACM3S0_11485 [Acidobacteriota bacterium]